MDDFQVNPIDPLLAEQERRLEAQAAATWRRAAAAVVGVALGIVCAVIVTR